jgi:hypothetical protein
VLSRNQSAVELENEDSDIAISYRHKKMEDIGAIVDALFGSEETMWLGSIEDFKLGEA